MIGKLILALGAFAKLIYGALAGNALGMAADVAKEKLGQASDSVALLFKVAGDYVEGLVAPQAGVTLTKEEALAEIKTLWGNVKSELYGAEGAVLSDVSALLGQALELIIPALEQVFIGESLSGLLTAAAEGAVAAL